MPKDFTVGKTAKVESVGIGAIFLRKINFVARNNVKEKNKHWREMDKQFFSNNILSCIITYKIILKEVSLNSQKLYMIENGIHFKLRQCPH